MYLSLCFGVSTISSANIYPDKYRYRTYLSCYITLLYSIFTINHRQFVQQLILCEQQRKLLSPLEGSPFVNCGSPDKGPIIRKTFDALMLCPRWLWFAKVTFPYKQNHASLLRACVTFSGILLGPIEQMAYNQAFYFYIHCTKMLTKSANK